MALAGLSFRKRALLCALALAASAGSASAAEPIRVEINAMEPAQARCRLTFVVENAGAAIDSLRLDLATFGKDGAIQRRLVAEMGPIRQAKTMVRAFEVDNACDTIGSVLVNDVAACAPASAGDCLDRLTLTQRGGVRLFK